MVLKPNAKSYAKASVDAALVLAMPGRDLSLKDPVSVVQNRAKE